jgi:hypothetical protein
MLRLFSAILLFSYREHVIGVWAVVVAVILITLMVVPKLGHREDVVAIGLIIM